MSPDPEASDLPEQLLRLRPDLARRLAHFEQERNRCLGYASKLSGWAMFWKVLVVSLGAVVAAQGAFAKAFGDAGWVAVLFVLLGVLISLGTAFQGIFKPAERSPDFAKVAFEYERAHRELTRAAVAAYRKGNNAGETLDAEVETALDAAEVAADLTLDEVRATEIGLYTAGVPDIGRHGAKRGWLRKLFHLP